MKYKFISPHCRILGGIPHHGDALGEPYFNVRDSRFLVILSVCHLRQLKKRRIPWKARPRISARQFRLQWPDQNPDVY